MQRWRQVGSRCSDVEGGSALFPDIASIQGILSFLGRTKAISHISVWRISALWRERAAANSRKFPDVQKQVCFGVQN